MTGPVNDRAAALEDELDAALREAGTPERAAGAKAYMKSDLEFYGVTLPVMRGLVRYLRREHGDLTRADVVELGTALWAEPVFERRLLAVLVLEAHVALLDARDLGLLEAWAREGAMWALVDNISGDVAGPLLDRLGEPVATATLDRWAADDDVWVRRSALLAHRRPLRAGGGDWDRFAGYADAMLEEKVFWIRKAIGWVLRDAGHARPELVHAWLVPRAHRASGVTLKEALKPLDEEQRSDVERARRDRAH